MSATTLFDEIARITARSTSRRQAFRLVAGAVAVSLWPRVARAHDDHTPYFPDDCEDYKVHCPGGKKCCPRTTRCVVKNGRVGCCDARTTSQCFQGDEVINCCLPNETCVGAFCCADSQLCNNNTVCCPEGEHCSTTCAGNPNMCCPDGTDCVAAADGSAHCCANGASDYCTSTDTCCYGGTQCVNDKLCCPPATLVVCGANCCNPPNDGCNKDTHYKTCCEKFKNGKKNNDCVDPPLQAFIRPGRDRAVEVLDSVPPGDRLIVVRGGDDSPARVNLVVNRWVSQHLGLGPDEALHVDLASSPGWMWDDLNTVEIHLLGRPLDSIDYTGPGGGDVAGLSLEWGDWSDGFVWR